MQNEKTISGQFNEDIAPYDFIQVRIKQGDKVEIRFEDLEIKIPKEERVLIENANILIQEGDRIGFTGPNGGGKSSLFRSIRELTSAGSGKITITLPDGKDIFVASQEIRKAPTTLPGILSYPNDPSRYTHAEFEQALKDAEYAQGIVQLPWNAVAPENIVRFGKMLVDDALRNFKTPLSGESIEQVTESFSQKLDKILKMPEPLQDYYTPEIHKQVITELTDYMRAQFTQAAQENGPEQKTSTLHFPGYTGRKIARRVGGSVPNMMDGWLLQGHRMRLSGGEQQKLGFARMFLHAPHTAIYLLDEVTPALKEDMAHTLYNRLFNDKAKGATAISIIHNENLLRHHTHHMKLDNNKHVSIAPVNQEQHPAYIPEL